MGLFTSRRGITPLVATILLVAFSVGLGALVMSWGEEYIEDKASFVQGTAEVGSGCDAAKIDIINIGGLPQACVGPGGLELWIDNGPDIDLHNIHARIVGTVSIDVIDGIIANPPLLKSNAVKATVSYRTDIGQVRQVRLTPTIWTGREVVLCSQSAINVEQLPPC